MPSVAERVAQLTDKSKIDDFTQLLADLQRLPRNSHPELLEVKGHLNSLVNRLRRKVEREPGRFAHLFSDKTAEKARREALLRDAERFDGELALRDAASAQLFAQQKAALEALAGTDDSALVNAPSGNVTRNLQDHVLALWTLPLEDVEPTAKAVGAKIRADNVKRARLEALVTTVDGHAKPKRLLEDDLDELMWRFPDLWFQRLGASTSGVFKIRLANGEYRVFKPVDFEPYEAFSTMPTMVLELWRDGSAEDQQRLREKRHQRLGLVARTTAIQEEAGYHLDQLLGAAFGTGALANVPMCQRITFCGKEGAAIAFVDGEPISLKEEQDVTDEAAHGFALFNFIAGQMDFWEAFRSGERLVAIDNALAFPDTVVVFPSAAELESVSDGLENPCKRPLSAQTAARLQALDPMTLSRALEARCPALRPTQLLELRVRLLYIQRRVAAGMNLVQVGATYVRAIPSIYEAAIEAIGCPRSRRYPVEAADWPPLAAALSANIG
jgi:hypothetical protein